MKKHILKKIESCKKVALCYHVIMSKYREKLKPQYDLDLIKELISKKSYLITGTAKNNALTDFFLSSKDIIQLIMQLQNTNFYKSMTSDNFPDIWQDVYHYKITTKDEAYIKLQINEEKTIIIQFKRK